MGNYTIKLIESSEQVEAATDLRLFFINLGGYQQGSFEEFHYKLLIVAPNQADAIKQAKKSDFYKQFFPLFKIWASPKAAKGHRII